MGRQQTEDFSDCLKSLRGSKTVLEAGKYRQKELRTRRQNRHIGQSGDEKARVGKEPKVFWSRFATSKGFMGEQTE